MYWVVLGVCRLGFQIGKHSLTSGLAPQQDSLTLDSATWIGLS